MLYAGIYVSPECEAVRLQQFVLVRLQLAATHRVGALLHFYAGNIFPPRTDMIFTQTNLLRRGNMYLDCVDISVDIISDVQMAAAPTLSIRLGLRLI